MRYIYRAMLHRVIDGDTIRAEMDTGFHSRHVESLRLLGVDTPELFSGADRERGAAARDFVIAWVNDACVDRGDNDIDWPFTVETFKDRQTFGRYLATVTRADTGESLADALVKAGYGVGQ